jgi:hypothetical protein
MDVENNLSDNSPKFKKRKKQRKKKESHAALLIHQESSKRGAWERCYYLHHLPEAL